MKKYRIDKNKNIGNVIFVVEGGRPNTGGTELRLLKKIFADLLKYEVQELRRGSDEFIGYGNNPNYRVFALNLPKNQLTQLTEDSIDALFCRLREEFNIKPEDCPIFFLYDRDVLSYKPNELRGKYVRKYTDPYGDEYGNQGQLLLSYPAIESYLISCLQDDVFNQSYCLGKDLKPVLTDALISENNNNKTDIHLNTVNLVLTDNQSEGEKRLIHSIKEMDKGLQAMNISEYNLDYLAPTLLAVYDYQQQKYISENTFTILSLVGLALLELGVITEVESPDDKEELEKENSKVV